MGFDDVRPLPMELACGSKNVYFRRVCSREIGGRGLAFKVPVLKVLETIADTPGWLGRLVAPDGFMPHGHCYRWDPRLVWLHVVSDGLIALAYISIPFTLTYFVRTRKQLPFSWMILCFGAFIVACGATHVLEIWSVWTPVYWLSGVVKAFTALASVSTAVLLVTLMPKMLAMPTASELASAHEALNRAHDELERRVSERTHELSEKNDDLSRAIAERERVENALRLSDARFRRLADSGIIGIVTADLQGVVSEANDAFLSMVGHCQSDVRSGAIRLAELTSSEWRDRDLRTLSRLQATGSAEAWETEYTRRDGSRVPVLIGAASLHGAQTCVAFVLDLSERRRAEASIARLRVQHAAQERYRALLDTAPDAMVVVDREERIELVNVRAEAMFGYERFELVGQPLELLIPERFRGSHAGYFADFFSNPETRLVGAGLELHGLRKDGAQFPIEVSLSPLRTGDRVTISAAIRDVTARKNAEAASAVLAARLASAVESIQDAFALFDDDNRLVLCNSVYRRLIGDSISGPLLGKSYEELLQAWLDDISFASEEDRTRFSCERLGWQRKSQTATFDLRMRDGRRLRVIDRRTPEGGIVKTIWDLTEDVRLAEELREAQIAAESASKAKSEFLSSMSHELRTPLNAILGFAQLLQRDKRDPLTERHRDRVSHILGGGQHLLRLIDDILDLARIEAGGVTVCTEPVSLLEVLTEVRTTLEPMAADESVHLEVETAPERLTVAVDRTRYAQILINLGSNAIKYNRPEGTVSFVISIPKPNQVRVTVRDTGWGIPEDKQAKLFQPFQRAGQENGPIQGTGIGLVITKRLAELMNGEIDFRSVPGEGSEFWIDVPAHRSERTSRPPAAIAASNSYLAQGATVTVLYVEDNPANVAFMTDLLSGFDQVELITASTAEVGIESARDRNPQVIIMDINLPGMSGLEALHALRQAPQTNQIPIIALTAAASERDRQKGLRAGFYRYLTKPVKVDELVSVLEGLFVS